MGGGDWREELHRRRLREVIDFTKKIVTDWSSVSILDIGTGIGLLYDELKKVTFIRNYVALEPVPAIALLLKKHFPTLYVLNDDIDNVGLPDNFFNIIFVCGVDYLFTDILQAFSKINKLLRDDGIVVISRNVFLDQTSYFAEPITSLDGLFKSNPIMRNWFHSEQYAVFIENFFQIEQRKRTGITYHLTPSTSCSGFEDMYLCRKKSLGQQWHYLEMREKCCEFLVKLGWRQNIVG